MLRRSLLVVSFTVLVLFGGEPAEAGPIPIISAPFVTVGVGVTFTIPISITGVTDLTSWQFDLAFNPTIVQANSVTEGPFMSAFGTTLFIPGAIDNTAGLISIVADFYVGLPPNPFGDGVLAYIEFTALSRGISPLTFSNVFLNLVDPVQISNGAAAVPEPTTLMLLASSGLALLGARRLAVRRRGNKFVPTLALWERVKGEGSYTVTSNRGVVEQK